MARFWVYIGDKIQGPVDIPSLRKISGFNLLTQVCLEGEQTWKMADEVIEIKSYFISPPRLNSFTVEAGNAAPKFEAFPAPAPKPKPILEELTLPEPNSLEQITGIATPKKGEPVTAGPASAAGLRMVCAVCDYKNPRDVAVCMKCGEKLGGAPTPAPAPTVASPTIAKPEPAVSAPAPKPSTESVPAPTAVDIKTSTMVEVSLGKLMIGVAIAAVVSAGCFWGFHSWKKKHPSVSHRPSSSAQSQTSDDEDAPSTKRSTPKKRTQSYGKHYDHPPVHRHSEVPAAALPGVDDSPDAAAEAPKPAAEKSPPSYRVIEEATPLKKRYSSPSNSPYAMKRRANKDLWTTQEGQAIEQVQRTRIYGGQRTIQRNVEILMQILRDREYNTAFESGKRLDLYNDLDWSAVQKEGPLYEVRLSFSGGKEADGSPKKPLHFAFASDLERATVEPGGQDQVRSNTLHAFFDESRIAPEDRRAIAKDTEELVLASQPDASPLAFDTVVRQFAKVYGTAALTRVADAFGISEIKKKLAHDPRLGSQDASSTPTPAVRESKKPSAPAKSESIVESTPIPMDSWVKAGMKVPPLAEKKASSESKMSSPKKTTSKVVESDGIEFQMESGQGGERTFTVRTVSHAPIGRIWEVLTGYDHLKQFVPDMLTSEREGQDGAAAIVHLTCLTRFMIFVFKLNLHLRIIEHPQQHTLEFERIAGDYESLRGSIEVVTDQATKDSQIIFHANVVPKGFMTNTKMESMARRLLIAQANAIRTKAESK